MLLRQKQICLTYGARFTFPFLWILNFLPETLEMPSVLADPLALDHLFLLLRSLFAHDAAGLPLEDDVLLDRLTRLRG